MAHRITSDPTAVREAESGGGRVAVGFRPSGDLHVGNLLSITYAAVLADELGKTVDLMCCDTDWSAHIHGHTRPDNNRVMSLFFERDCPCGDHENVAHHHMDTLQPFLDGLRDRVSADITGSFLTDIAGDEHYLDALRAILSDMDAFDDIFGGGFRRRYRSPVAANCDACGHAHAKGAAYSARSDELVFACRNEDCGNGFAARPLSGRIGVYYLVDPVRDPGRDVAVHVFGGDYRDAQKEQKTSKAEKVAKITELATGETPTYFLAPLIADAQGKPLSKSKGNGMHAADIDDLESYGRALTGQVFDWIDAERRHVPQQALHPGELR